MSACPTSSRLTSSFRELSVIFASHNKTSNCCLFNQGLAYKSGICKNYAKDIIRHGEDGVKEGYKTRNVGLVTFNGSSLSANPIITFAHEVGHNLGAEHDGEGNECNPTRYMMAAETDKLPKDHQKIFSNCSKKYFKSEMEEIEKV